MVGSLRDVQMLAGHAALSTTQRYIEADVEAQRKVVVCGRSNAGRPSRSALCRRAISNLGLRSFRGQHGLQDLFGNISHGSRRVRQEKRVGLIVFADGFKCIKILCHQH